MPWGKKKMIFTLTFQLRGLSVKSTNIKHIYQTERQMWNKSIYVSKGEKKNDGWTKVKIPQMTIINMLTWPDLIKNYITTWYNVI